MDDKKKRSHPNLNPKRLDLKGMKLDRTFRQCRDKNPERGTCGHLSYVLHRKTGRCLECYLAERRK